MKKQVIFIAIFVLLIAAGYFNRHFFASLFSVVESNFYPPDLAYVKTNPWQHSKGFKIGDGDFVEFTNGDTIFQLKEDTIYFKGKPRAIVVKTNKHFYQMYVTSIDGSEKGEYANTEEFTK